MTENLRLALEADKTYKDWGSYNDGTTFDLETGPVCGDGDTNATCIMNGNTMQNIGNYSNEWLYSWYAATAGKGIDSSSLTDISGSICPKGWRMPPDYVVSQNKSYGILNKTYLGFAGNTWGDFVSSLESIPLSMYMAGGSNRGAVGHISDAGRYWSSTNGDGIYARRLFYNTSQLYPNTGGDRSLGHSVRCVSI